MIRGLGRVALFALLALAIMPVACNDTGTGPVSPAPVAMVIPAATVAITGDVGSTVADSISVRVLDAAGNGIAGVAVQFATTAGGGSVSPSAVTSGANGIARTMWTLGSAAGTQTLEVRTGTSTVAALVVQATARAAAPAQVQKPTGDPTTAPAGSPVPLTVLVVDRFGNPTAGVSVTWQAVAGGGSVSPSVSVSDNSGLARTTWTLGAAGTNRVDASVSATIAASFTATATVVIAPVASVSVTSSAPSITIGGNVTLTVTARDAAGNVLAGRVATFASSAPAIATVDAGGVVRALSVGQTTITATSEGKTAQVVVTVTAAPPVAPVAPTGLTATAASSNQINLAWQDNSGDETGFEVESQAAGATTWTALATLPPNTAQYSHTSLPPSTTYTYRVRACANAVCSAYTSTASASTPPAAGTSAPLVTTTRVLSVRRDPFGGPDAATFSSQTIPNGLATTTWFEWGTSATLVGAASTPPKDAGAGTTPFENIQTVNGLAQATTYYYRGVAQNSAGTTRGAILSFTTERPSTPQVQVALNATGLAVVVTWTHPGDNGTLGYQIKRREGTTTVPVPGGSLLDYSPLRSTTDSTYALNVSHTFFYVVEACNQINCTASAEASITTPALAAPTALTVTGTTATSVSLSWTDNAANETAYWVWRRAVGPTGAAFVGKLAANTTSFTDDGTPFSGGNAGAPVSGTTYFYYVVAQGRGTTSLVPENFSAPSNEVQIVPGATGGGTPPTVTTGRVIGITRDPFGGPDAATLSSQTIPNGLPTTTWFEWGMSPTLFGAASTPAKDAGAGATSFENLQSVSGLTRQASYFYRGVAQNAAGITRGAILSFTTEQPSVPQAQVAMNATGLGVVVTWLHPGDNGTYSYQIRRREGATTVAVPGGFLDYSSLRSFTDSTYTLNASHTFFYTVDACNFIGCNRSGEVSLTTPALAAPSALTMTSKTATSVSLSWTDNAGNETAYWVWRRTVGQTAAAASLVGQLPANTTTFTDNGTAIQGPGAPGAPVTGTTYFYFVVAQGRGAPQYNPNDYSAPSNEVQVVP